MNWRSLLGRKQGGELETDPEPTVTPDAQANTQGTDSDTSAVGDLLLRLVVAVEGLRQDIADATQNARQGAQEARQGAIAAEAAQQAVIATERSQRVWGAALTAARAAGRTLPSDADLAAARAFEDGDAS